MDFWPDVFALDQRTGVLNPLKHLVNPLKNTILIHNANTQYYHLLDPLKNTILLHNANTQYYHLLDPLKNTILIHNDKTLY